MQVLITGGAGFIGSHCVEAALAQGWRVRVLDDLSAGKMANLEAAQALAGDRLEVRIGDIRDAPTVRSALTDCDAVLHLAAQVSVRASVDDPAHSATRNVLGFVNLADQASRQRVSRVVYASSAAVYGMPVSLPLDETSPTAPISPYGLEKLIDEQYAALFGALHGLSSLGLRFFNVYGPRQDPRSPYAGVIGKFCDALARDEPLTIYGDGRQTRDFIYVGDVAQACMAALQSRVDGVVAVGTGRSVDLLALVAALERVSSRRARLRFEAPQAGDIRESACRPAALQRHLGVVAATSLESGLEQLWRWSNGCEAA
jgi:UDP-glucose 4-epimerase